jgi:hypothetical protein
VLPFLDGLNEFACAHPSSAAVTNFDCASTIRVARLVAANPAKTKELFMGTASLLITIIKLRQSDIGISLFLSER